MTCIHVMEQGHPTMPPISASPAFPEDSGIVAVCPTCTEMQQRNEYPSPEWIEANLRFVCRECFEEA